MDATESGRRSLIGRVAGAVTGRVVAVVDPDTVLEQVDLDALLTRVDLDALLARVDINLLLDRVDLQRQLLRLDMNALLARVDVHAVVARSGIPEVVAASTGHLAVSVLDVARSRVARTDAAIDRGLDRVLHRTGQVHGSAAPPAGLLSRALAALADLGISTALFTAGYAATNVLLEAFLGRSLWGEDSPGWTAAALAAWSFLYQVVALTLVGYTPGKRLLGTRVTRPDGRPVGLARAVARTVLVPVSGGLFGLGYLIAVVDRRHRALHDLAAGTVVVRGAAGG